MEVEGADYVSTQDKMAHLAKFLVCLLSLFTEAVSPPYAPAVLVDSQTRSRILYE